MGKNAPFFKDLYLFLFVNFMSGFLKVPINSQMTKELQFIGINCLLAIYQQRNGTTSVLEAIFLPIQLHQPILVEMVPIHIISTDTIIC